MKMCRRFLKQTEGTILVFWAIALIALLGLIALSFDFGRLATTHAELQAYADHVALAAAGELDGNPDAITRATKAAADLVSGSQTFGSGDHVMAGSSDYTLAFYATLPSADTSALTSPTTDPTKAQYVSVTATPRDVGLTFGRVLYGLFGKPIPTPVASATAVAGFTQYACDITPMMMCVAPTFDADTVKGTTILLRSGGQGAAWQPGDFGFLDPTSSGIIADQTGPCAGLSPNGSKYYECLMAAEGNITQCFSQRGVDTEPGQKNGIENAVFNVRFDMYSQTMLGQSNNPAYLPAPNVIKGIVPKSGGNGKGNGCIGNNPAPSADTVPLPPDDCFASGTCTRFGDGNWSAGLQTYMSTNYGSNPPDFTAYGWDGKTRYSLYKAEIAYAGGPLSTNPILSGRQETGRPMCSSNQSIYPDRRTIVVAGIDCTANPISGKATNVPVKQFVKMFLLQPVTTNASSPPILSIYAEVIGSAQGYGGAGGTGGLFHDVVQLYR